ncbi:MAG: hypothetical protein JST16_13095 [Bdellovibrionales bacterium]|nr:hypothetical protein [Bdellovibrionales bacterium]
MFALRRFSMLVSVLSLSACMKPIKRDLPPVKPVAAPKVKAGENPDLVKRRVWVLPFSIKPFAKEFKEVPLREVLTKNLVLAFSKPESPFVTDITDDVEFKELTVDSSTPAEDLLRTARAYGIGGFLKGVVTHFGQERTESPEGILRTITTTYKLAAEFELFDGTTGRKMFSGTAQETLTESRSQIMTGEPDVEELTKKAEQISYGLGERILTKITPFAEKLGWQGRIVRMDGSRFYLNAGRRTGLQVGDTLRVVDNMRDIVDPQTGKAVGQAPGRVKGLIKVSEHFGVDGCMAVLLSGGGMAVGDRVELY